MGTRRRRRRRRVWRTESVESEGGVQAGMYLVSLLFGTDEKGRRADLYPSNRTERLGRC